MNNIKKIKNVQNKPEFNKAFEEDAEAPSPLGFITQCTQQQQLVETIHNDVVHNSRIDFYSTAFRFGEINLLSDPFDEDIVQASKSNSTKLVRCLDHPTKKMIIEAVFYTRTLDYEVLQILKNLLNHETIEGYSMI
ncbi:unnamed protein product [Rotaria sordida]|uniref:Uncharacterized protein n=1 Tax=Rotaria sordida TaxID=392033 RepID=A0A814EQX2_9BILA|nr:unnamed protein product [Rotaria sordida]CAF1032497.1 unnamed protein product [Rotaria sordida]